MILTVLVVDTSKHYGDVRSKGSKVINGFCSLFNRRKSMIPSDNTIQTEGLSDFFQNLGKKGLNVSKKGKKMY